eukprot:g10306.t1
MAWSAAKVGSEQEGWTPAKPKEANSSDFRDFSECVEKSESMDDLIAYMYDKAKKRKVVPSGAHNSTKKSSYAQASILFTGRGNEKESVQQFRKLAREIREGRLKGGKRKNPSRKFGNRDDDSSDTEGHPGYEQDELVRDVNDGRSEGASPMSYAPTPEFTPASEFGRSPMGQIAQGIRPVDTRAHKAAIRLQQQENLIHQRTEHFVIDHRTSSRFEELLAHAKHERLSEPVLTIVLPNRAQSLVNLINGREFFEEHTFRPLTRKERMAFSGMKSTQRFPKIIHGRKFSVELVDSLAQIRHWGTVAAVFLDASKERDWSLDEWPFARRVHLFAAIRGFYLKFQNEPVKSDVCQSCDVTGLTLPEKARHKDDQVAGGFWKELEKHLGTRSQMAFCQAGVGNLKLKDYESHEEMQRNAIAAFKLKNSTVVAHGNNRDPAAGGVSVAAPKRMTQTSPAPNRLLSRNAGGDHGNNPTVVNLNEIRDPRSGRLKGPDHDLQRQKLGLGGPGGSNTATGTQQPLAIEDGRGTRSGGAVGGGGGSFDPYAVVEEFMFSQPVHAHSVDVPVVADNSALFDYWTEEKLLDCKLREAQKFLQQHVRLHDSVHRGDFHEVVKQQFACEERYASFSEPFYDDDKKAEQRVPVEIINDRTASDCGGKRVRWVANNVDTAKYPDGGYFEVFDKRTGKSWDKDNKDNYKDNSWGGWGADNQNYDKYKRYDSSRDEYKHYSSGRDEYKSGRDSYDNSRNNYETAARYSNYNQSSSYNDWNRGENNWGATGSSQPSWGNNKGSYGGGGGSEQQERTGARHSQPTYHGSQPSYDRNKASGARAVPSGSGNWDRKPSGNWDKKPDTVSAAKAEADKKESPKAEPEKMDVDMDEL